MTLSFKGSTAFITGGTSDLAIELAGLLISQGIRPCLSYRNESGREKIIAGLTLFPDSYDTCILDFSDPSTIEPAFTPFNRLDYLIDFAHGDYEDLVASAASSVSSRYFNENISCRAVMIKAATRIMIRSGYGRLVFVSSAAAGRPGKGQGFYAASKLASEALYRNTALEMGRFGITAVSLRPGFIDCGRGKTFIEKKKTDPIKQIKKIPSNLILTMADVARTVLFLLSDSARGFNATELVMDGGYSSGKTD